LGDARAANLDAGERAILFSVHDTPLLKAVDRFRIEPHEQRHQVVVGEFDATDEEA
jgi:hypothetical protein